MGSLVSQADRVTPNRPGADGGWLRGLQGEGLRELAKLYTAVFIVASVVIIAFGAIGLAIGLAWRLLALAAGQQ